VIGAQSSEALGLAIQQLHIVLIEPGEILDSMLALIPVGVLGGFLHDEVCFG
jgi:hypothetical protein